MVLPHLYICKVTQEHWPSLYNAEGITKQQKAWWRHQIETFSALLAICAGNSPVPGEFPAQRPVTRSFDVFFDLRLNKRLSKQSWGWWLETLSRPLWCHCNGTLEHDTHAMWMTTRVSKSVPCDPTCVEATTLKRKCLHFDEIFITGCTVSFQNDNL